MPRAIRLALLLVTIGTILAVSCMVKTTAISMTLLFSVSLPAFGLAAVLYVVEVVRDLRRHRVL